MFCKIGKTAKSILISCGARLAPFDIQEVRDITAYDELQLDTLGDRKTALFLIMSDTDSTFNFLISMIYTQLFNLLCEKADDVYGGRLPVHVRFLIDEAANIGQIPNLEKLVATIRHKWSDTTKPQDTFTSIQNFQFINRSQVFSELLIVQGMRSFTPTVFASVISINRFFSKCLIQLFQCGRL